MPVQQRVNPSARSTASNPILPDVAHLTLHVSPRAAATTAAATTRAYLDGTGIQYLRDQSGNGNDLTSTSNYTLNRRTQILNGFPSLSNPGSGFLTSGNFVGASYNSAMTLYAVVDLTGNPFGTAALRYVIGAAGAAYIAYDGTNTNLKYVWGGTTINAGAPYHKQAILWMTCDGATLTVGFDNTVLGTASVSPNTFSSNAILFGNFSNGAMPCDVVNLGDGLLYNAAHGASTRASVIAALQQLSGINSLCNFAIEGDSQSVAYGLTQYLNGYTDQLVDLLWPNFQRRYSTAYGGKTTANATSDAAKIDAAYDATAIQNVLILFIGTNNVQAGDSAATIQSFYQTYVQARKATGWRLVISTIPPRGTFSGPQETVRQTINSWLLANRVLVGYDAVVDPGSDAVLATPGSTNFYQADTIHFNPKGHARVAKLMADGLRSVVAGL